jgi:glucose-6-phosphate isomerase
MAYSKQQLWHRFQKYYTEFPTAGLALDLSRVNFPDDFFSRMEPQIQKAFSEMADLEKGAIANRDENRMVGHYWLRNPSLAPTSAIRDEIEQTVSTIRSFANDVHNGVIRGASGLFKNLLLIGIGGSALGPQFVANALSHPDTDKLTPYFFDNTDPDGMDRVLARIGSNLGQTLCIIVSKSGGTKETRNGMLEAAAAFRAANVAFERHAVAITSHDSELDRLAKDQKWLTRFPMWDWVGGRTSELSAVGLLPAALQGFTIDSILEGARVCDEITRVPKVKDNPAAQLALMWFYIGNGKGDKNLIILPYKDRLELFSKYLQQLIMESLGKRLDRDGKVVNQGITVLGNKGSTDQHSYIQQLRDGLSNFFVIFIEALRDRRDASMLVEPKTTSGDYLNGFMLGTRSALYESDRQSITVTVPTVTPFSIGVLIALFERTVGLYASLVNVNAYHQPGVEAGKKAATSVISLLTKIIAQLQATRQPITPAELAKSIQAEEDIETVFKICEHLAANTDRQIQKAPGSTPFEATYTSLVSSP